MCGQSRENSESRAFDAIMNLMSWLLDNDLRNNPSFDDSLLGWYRKSGHPDWLELYGPEHEEIGHEMMSSVGYDLGIPKVSDEMDLDEIADQFESLLELTQAGIESDDPELERKALINGMRWMLFSRSWKISIWCQLQFACPIGSLIQKCDQGDIDSFLNLVKLDSTFLSTRAARKILAEMELRNDLNLRSRLALSLDSSEGFWKLEGGRRNIRNYLAIVVLDQIGFQAKPYSAWSTFLVEKDFDNFADTKAIAQACNRLGIEKQYPGRKKNIDY